MPSPLRWPDAALAGLGSSMRTFAGPAALAAHGRITGKPRIAVFVLAAGELATDKTSAATDRTDLPAVAGRVVAGAYTGREIAGGAGAAAGAVAGWVGTYTCWRARKLVVDTTGLPDQVVAVGEDIVAMGIAAIGARPDPEPDPAQVVQESLPGVEATESAETTVPGRARTWLADAGAGLVAGVVGTAVMTIAQGAEFVLTDAEPSDSPALIADQIKRRVGKGKLKKKHKRVANQGMHWLYGTSWGIPYGIVAARSKVPPEVSGPVFGALVWAAALAHEPALGLAELPWKRSLQSLGSEALFHVVYGVGAGAALRELRNRAG